MDQLEYYRKLQEELGNLQSSQLIQLAKHIKIFGYLKLNESPLSWTNTIVRESYSRKIPLPILLNLINNLPKSTTQLRIEELDQQILSSRNSIVDRLNYVQDRDHLTYAYMQLSLEIIKAKQALLDSYLKEKLFLMSLKET